MLINQQGNLWVAPLPEGDWTKAVLQKQGKDKKKEKEGEKDGSTKDGSKRGESVHHDAIEIAPMWRHVILKEGSLVLKGSDGIEEHISLEGCEVVAVSAGASEGGKWYVPLSFLHSILQYLFCLDVEGLLSFLFFICEYGCLILLWSKGLSIETCEQG